MLVGIPSRAHQQKRTCKWSRQLTIFLEHVCNMFNLDLVSIRNFPKLNTSFVTEWKNGIVCPIHTPNCAKTSQNTTQWICIGSLYKATQPFKCKNVCQNENHPYLIVLFFYHKSAQIHNKHQKWIKKLCQNPKKQWYEINCLPTGKVSKDAKTSISSIHEKIRPDWKPTPTLLTLAAKSHMKTR